MKHYAIDQWADFARNVITGDQAAHMQAHLQSGCADCRRLSEFSANVARTCTGMASNSVPDQVLRLARAIFPVRMQQRPGRGTRLPIRTIFDSFLMPAEAGLRSSWQVGWQGLYRAGDYSIDLRIEPELSSSRAAIVGQISSHLETPVDLGNLPVSLRAGKTVAAETISNRFGEFQMEYEQQARLKLFIALRDGKTVQVPLKKLTSDQTAAKSRSTT
jgi:hypothetical protein